MSLPLSPPRFAFGIDDVLPVEAVNRLAAHTNDLREHLGREHLLVGGAAGHHNLIPVPIAWALFRRNPNARVSSADGMVLAVSRGAWRSAPRWTVHGRIQFEVRREWTSAQLFGSGVTGSTAYGGTRQQHSDGWVGWAGVGTREGGFIGLHLPDWDQDLQLLMVAVYGRTA